VPGSAARPNEAWRSNVSPGMLLDFRRFSRDMATSFSSAMVTVLRASQGGSGVRGIVTTNAPGGSWAKAMDHADVFSTMDQASYDNYPVWGGSKEAPLPSTVALALDRVRGWKAGDQGWVVAEQLIGAQVGGQLEGKICGAVAVITLCNYL